MGRDRQVGESRSGPTLQDLPDWATWPAPTGVRYEETQLPDPLYYGYSWSDGRVGLRPGLGPERQRFVGAHETAHEWQNRFGLPIDERQADLWARAWTDLALQSYNSPQANALTGGPSTEAETVALGASGLPLPGSYRPRQRPRLVQPT